MSAFRFFGDGWQVMRTPGRWRLVSLFFGLYLVVAAAAAAPLYHAMGSSPGGNLFAREMLRGFDAAWATDFMFANAGFIEFFSRVIVWAAILFALLQAVLWAGALEVLRHGLQPPTWIAFFGKGCARNFGPFLRLVLLGAVLYYVAFAILNSVALRLVEQTTRNVLPEWPQVVLNWARVSLLLLALFAINLVLDYARVRIVLEDRSSAVLAFAAALRLLRGRFRPAAGAYALWGIAGLALAAIYLGLAAIIPQSNVPGIIFWFFIAQAFIFLRLWVRMGFYGSALSIAFDAAPPPGPPTFVPMHFE